ncbi:MAG: hypothetical protein CM1200mP29_14490 [Verrucomicrobiota bacterium]|nr:MAG: hypothetical protein CM1200mP29_14490 [Verrucomicrobiota bacterium]
MPHVPLADHAGFVTGIFQHLGNRDLALGRPPAESGNSTTRLLDAMPERTGNRPVIKAARLDVQTGPGGIELSPLLPLMRHAIKVRRVNGRMTVARHSPYPWSSVKITTKFSCSLANPDEPKPSATPKPSAPSFKPFKKREFMPGQPTKRPDRWKKKKPDALIVDSFKNYPR